MTSCSSKISKVEFGECREVGYNRPNYYVTNDLEYIYEDYGNGYKFRVGAIFYSNNEIIKGILFGTEQIIEFEV